MKAKCSLFFYLTLFYLSALAYLAWAIVGLPENVDTHVHHNYRHNEYWMSTFKLSSSGTFNAIDDAKNIMLVIQSNFPSSL